MKTAKSLILTTSHCLKITFQMSLFLAFSTNFCSLTSDFSNFVNFASDGNDAKKLAKIGIDVTLPGTISGGIRCEIQETTTKRPEGR